MVYVEAEQTAELDFKEMTVTKGGFVLIPKKIVHAFSTKNSSFGKAACH